MTTDDAAYRLLIQVAGTILAASAVAIWFMSRAVQRR